MRVALMGRPPDDAPFRSYNKTDDQVRADGYERGLEWPASWNYIPGGPYFPKPSPTDHQDWKDYCEIRTRHNRIWLEGWFDGVKEAARTNGDLRAMLGKLVFDKLSS